MNSCVIKWTHNFLNTHPKCKFCEISHIFCPVVCLVPVKWYVVFPHPPFYAHYHKTKNLYSYTFYVPSTIRGWESFLKPTVWTSPSLLYTGYWVLSDQVIKLPTQLLLVPRLRMSGDVLSLPCLISWCAQRQFLPSLQPSFSFHLNQSTFHYATGLHIYVCNV